MKALILKDLYMLQKQLKVMLAVVVLYALLFVPQGMVDMIAFMMVMFSVMFVLTSMSFDETLKWDRYALSGPLTRRDLVGAKYVLALLLVLAGFVVGMLSYVVIPLFLAAPRPFVESLATLASANLAGLLVLAVILPLMYKLGVEKSRLLMIGVVLVPVAAVMLYVRYAPQALELFIIRYAIYFPAALLLLAIFAYLISYKVSLRIYNNKDF